MLALIVGCAFVGLGSVSWVCVLEVVVLLFGCV